MYFLGGNILAEEAIVKNILFITIFSVIILMYIANRYSCIEKQKEIVQLEHRLKMAKYEALTTSALLMGNSREIKIESMIKNSGLTIQINTSPIYKVK